MMTSRDRAIMATVQTVMTSLMNPRTTPLTTVVVVPIWLAEDGDSYKSAPSMVGEPASVPYLVDTLRMFADKLEAGEYRLVPTGTSAPGGDA